MPKNSTELEVSARSLGRKSPSEFANVLSSIPKDDYKFVFGGRLADYKAISTIISVLTYFRNNPKLIVDILSAIVENPRFDLLKTFLSKKEKQGKHKRY